MKRRLLMRDIPEAWTSGHYFMDAVRRWFPNYQARPWNSTGFENSQRTTAARERDMQSEDAMVRTRARGDLGKLREAVAAHSSHVWRRR